MLFQLETDFDVGEWISSAVVVYVDRIMKRLGIYSWTAL
ncbi:hypothetical protein LINGRAHAP2_LOCUS29411 [Linum grandiflorum]